MRAGGTSLLIIGFLLCSVLALSLPTVSSPTEHHLAGLIESSDLVAVADIVDVAEAPANPVDAAAGPAAGLPRVARLSLLHVWKGEQAGTIGVPFEDCLSWPSGPGYLKGRRVVVFLDKTPGGWTTLDMAPVPGDATSGPLESLDLDLLGHGPGATCLPGLSIQRPGTIIQ